MLMFSSSAEALIVLQQGSSTFDTQYDTNPLLREDKQSVRRYTITPRYQVAAVEDENRWYANAALALQRSSDKRITQDREDPNVNIGWQRDSERGRFSIAARYDKRSSRFSEFNQTGFVDVDGSAITKSLSADWSRSLTERLGTSIGAQYTKTTYDTSRFSDSVTKSINASLNYEFNERVSPFVQVAYTDFQSDDVINNNGLLINNGNNFFVNNNAINNVNNGGDNKSKSISVGATILLSPLWTFTSSIGMNKVDSSNQNANTVIRSSTGSGKIGSFSLDYKGERSSFRSELSRSVSPSGIGGFVESDRFNLGYEYLLSERSTIGGGYSINKNKSDFSSESTQISAWYSKELSEMWQMRVSAESRNQKNFNQSVSGNVVGLTFTYSTPEF